MLEKVMQLLKGQVASRHIKLNYGRWIFSSVDNNAFNYNSKYLFLYVREHFPHIEARYVIRDEKKRRQLKDQYGQQYFIGADSREDRRTILEGGVWFTSAGLPVYTWGRTEGRILINLWHGIPLKKIVLLEEHVGRLQQLYFKQVFSVKYTAILTTSQELIPLMAKSFGVPQNRIKVWGQPRDDVIMQSHKREEFLGRFSLGEDCRKLLLYAPTYRDDGPTRLFPFEDYEEEKLERFLEEKGWYLCLRVHLSEQNKEFAYEGSHILKVNEDFADDIAEWMSCFDLLITDYSSIYLDYLLLERPILFLPYDEKEYLKQRGMNFVYKKVTPGPRPKDQKTFLEDLEMLLEGEDVYRKQRVECRDYFNQIRQPCRGEICRRVQELIEKKEQNPS